MSKFMYQIHKRYLKTIPLKMDNVMDIKSFIFLDIETTGLPNMENNKTKMTELCMVAVEANHIGLGVFPRVQNKLSFCFNPWKLISADSEKITGLSNNILEHQSTFSSNTVNTINSFLNHCQKPLCFVAHNGNFFDYPVLRREIQNSGAEIMEGILCIDSLLAFKQLHSEELKSNVSELGVCEVASRHSLSIETDDVDGEHKPSKKVYDVQKLNETTPKKQLIEVFPCIPNPAKKLKVVSYKENLDVFVSFKLIDVYKRLTKQLPNVKEHEAESDVTMLITCAATLGDKFVNWANSNAKNFCDIPPMVPGKKIGT